MMKRSQKGEGFVVAQAMLLFLIAWSGRKKGRVPRGQKSLGLALLGGATLLGLASGSQLGRNFTPLPEPLAEGDLVTSGTYAYVRHPIYTSLLLLGTGFSLWRGSLVSLGWTALLALLFDRKATFEEAKLAVQYPAYPAYMRRVGKFWPRLRHG